MFFSLRPLSLSSFSVGLKLNTTQRGRTVRYISSLAYVYNMIHFWKAVLKKFNPHHWLLSIRISCFKLSFSFFNDWFESRSSSRLTCQANLLRSYSLLAFSTDCSRHLFNFIKVSWFWIDDFYWTNCSFNGSTGISSNIINSYLNFCLVVGFASFICLLKFFRFRLVLFF